MSDLKTVAIVQARMSSSRLPGKVLLDIAGDPMLVRVVERVRRARLVNAVCVATTTDITDDPIATLCRERGYLVYRGSQFDVLDRFYQAAKQFEAEVIVRITADCPLIDPTVIDHTLKAFFYSRADFAANRLPPPWKRTYPIGLDTEVCTFSALECAWNEATAEHQREHVMSYLYEQEGRFKVLVVDHEPDYGSMRWTVDTPQDLEFVRQVYARFGGRLEIGWTEILALLKSEPDLARINADVEHKTGRDVDPRARSK